MKVLVIGKGGREHAIVHAAYKSPKVKEVFVAPGNVGMMKLATLVNIDETELEKLAEFAEKEKIDLTIVGPEVPLSLGVVNIFEKKGLKIFGPTKKAAKIEASKEFAKELMEKYGVPTARYKSFNNFEDSYNYIKEQTFPCVIKEDGLRAGKGVTIVYSLEEAEDLLKQLFEVENKVIIEDFLEGFEFSMIAMVNEDIVIPLELAQDHKRAYDNDKGPNTGGMGCYSPINKIDKKTEEEALEKVFYPMVNGMKKDGITFKGFLFAGLMKTIEGVKVIEFNARLGDPETQVILPRLESDFIEIILDLLEKKESKLKWSEEIAIGVVMAGKDYPSKGSKGVKIEIDENIDSILYHMGTKIEDGKLVTNGGRVLTVVSFGKTLEEAQKNVYNNVNKISCEDLMFRKDIGNKGV